MDNIWENYGMTREEWLKLDEETIEKLTGQDWHTEPCIVCEKPVLVAGVTEKVLCLEHAERSN